MFPAIFKKAVVKPLLKKSSLDPNELKNYRPVSNLPFLSKILEKIVLSQLLSHLNHYKLLSPVQSAYRPHHSTETALLRMVNDILAALDQGKIATLALMDLSAAFDTIDHEILIQRLCNVFGLRDTVLSFIKSYLSNREQVVAVADCKSDPSYLKFGVPQGSVLGPILFIMYTQPLSNIISQSQINHVAFADDTQLYDYCCLPNVSSMLTKFEEGISHISSWMSANKLSLNPSKTEALLLSSPRNSVSDSLPSSIIVDGSIIEFSNSVKSLGVTLDSTLSMKDHVLNICKLSYYELRRISSVRRLLTLEATKTLVCSFVLSRLEYCNFLLF